MSDNRQVHGKIQQAAQGLGVTVSPAINVEDAKRRIDETQTNDTPYDAILVATPQNGDKQATTRAIKNGDFDTLPTVLITEPGQRLYATTDKKTQGTLPIEARGNKPLDAVKLEDVLKTAIEQFKQTNAPQVDSPEALEKAALVLSQFLKEAPISKEALPDQSKVREILKARESSDHKSSSTTKSWRDELKPSSRQNSDNDKGGFSK